MRRVGVLVAALLAAAAAHVPGYDAVDGCARLKHPPSLSQVAYQTVPVGATAGLEFHVRSDTYPVDTTDSDGAVDFDFTFRDEVDPSTFALFVGCGGCALGDDVPTERIAVDYKQGVIEPCVAAPAQPLLRIPIPIPRSPYAGLRRPSTEASNPAILATPTANSPRAGSRSPTAPRSILCCCCAPFPMPRAR